MNTKQLAPVTFLICEHYISNAEEISIVAEDYIFDFISNIYQNKSIEIYKKSDFTKEFSDYSDEIHYIFHHYQMGSQFASSMIKARASQLRDSISYYADGYVNTFIDHESLIKKDPILSHVKNRYAYSFDATNPYYEKSMTEVSHIQISSSYFDNFLGRMGITQELSEVYQKLPKNKCSFVLLALRPWGSSSFHGGNYQLKNGALDFLTILNGLISAIKKHINEKTFFIIKGDDRDQEINRQIISLLEDNNEFENNYIIMDDFYPRSLTLDPFIFFFKEIMNAHFYTATLDSTTALPFIYRKFSDGHFIGAPRAIVDSIDGSEALSKHYSRKVEISLNHLQRVNESNEYNIQIKSLEDGFFCYSHI